MRKVHYAPGGEWGGEKTNCNRYYTSDVLLTGDKSKVTCKYCCSNISKAEKWASEILDADKDFQELLKSDMVDLFTYKITLLSETTTLNIGNLKPDHSLKIINKGKEPIILSNGINIINGKTYICGIDRYDEDSSLGNTKSPSN